MNAIIPVAPTLETEVGRFVYVARHPFADPEKLWVPQGVNLHEIVALAFPQTELRSYAVVRVAGEEISVDAWDCTPKLKQRIEIRVRAQKGIIRAAIVLKRRAEREGLN